MGRIVTSVLLENIIEHKKMTFTGLVDSGASHLILPAAWREQLGPLEEIRKIHMSLANQDTVTGTVCGPVKITLKGFEPVFSEIVFVEMKEERGTYEPIIGYIPLEQCQAAIDFVGHRLVPGKKLDLK